MNPALVLAPDHLQELATTLLVAGGAAADEASLVAASLVESNLCGHESHGVVRVAEYVDLLGQGELVSGARLSTLNETPAVFHADAGKGFGQVQMRTLCDVLADKARSVGTATGTLRNSGHVGRLGEWVERLAAAGLASLLTVNDDGVLKCVAPPGGTAPRISTNPIAIAIPTSGDPLVLDLSTSVVANGKIRVAELAGEPCPPGWLLDAAGEPTTDPGVRRAEPPGSILPVGGSDHGYKGFGLGLLLDLLVGGLSGGCCPPAPPDAPGTNNVLMTVWDPAQFGGTDHFLAQAGGLLEFVRSTPLRDPDSPIRLPGDRSGQLRAERREHGIPLDQGTWRALTELARRLDVPLD